MGKKFEPKIYTVSDGRLVLFLEEDEKSGFSVWSPMYRGLNTQAETVAEAFKMAYDALEALELGKRQIARIKKRERQAKVKTREKASA